MGTESFENFFYRVYAGLKPSVLIANPIWNGFVWASKTRGGGRLLPLLPAYLNFCSAVSPTVVKFIKLFNRIVHKIELWINTGLSTYDAINRLYTVRNLFCLLRRHKIRCSQQWCHKHTIIGLTNKSGVKRLLMWGMQRCFKKIQIAKNLSKFGQNE